MKYACSQNSYNLWVGFIATIDDIIAELFLVGVSLEIIRNFVFAYKLGMA